MRGTACCASDAGAGVVGCQHLADLGAHSCNGPVRDVDEGRVFASFFATCCPMAASFDAPCVVTLGMLNPSGTLYDTVQSGIHYTVYSIFHAQRNWIQKADRKSDLGINGQPIISADLRTQLNGRFPTSDRCHWVAWAWKTTRPLAAPQSR